LRRIAAQLRLRVRNKSRGFQLDYSSFAILPSTVNVPYGCKIDDSENFRDPFDMADAHASSPSSSPDNGFDSNSLFSNNMPLSNRSPSSLTALAKEFVPSCSSNSSNNSPIRPPSFDVSPQPIQQPLLLTPGPLYSTPPMLAPLPVVAAEVEAEAELQEDGGEAKEGEISECIPVLCKYGNSCSRPGCHFMHSMRPSVIRRCKYDNLCIRSDCHFSHPNGRPLLKAKPRALRRNPNKNDKNNSNSLGLPPGDLAARVMTLAAMGYNVSSHVTNIARQPVQQPMQPMQKIMPRTLIC
jgi:hypothetical protein